MTTNVTTNLAFSAPLQARFSTDTSEPDVYEHYLIQSSHRQNYRETQSTAGPTDTIRDRGILAEGSRARTTNPTPSLSNFDLMSHLWYSKNLGSLHRSHEILAKKLWHEPQSPMVSFLHTIYYVRLFELSPPNPHHLRHLYKAIKFTEQISQLDSQSPLYDLARSHIAYVLGESGESKRGISSFISRTPSRSPLRSLSYFLRQREALSSATDHRTPNTSAQILFTEITNSPRARLSVGEPDAITKIALLTPLLRSHHDLYEILNHLPPSHGDATTVSALRGQYFEEHLLDPAGAFHHYHQAYQLGLNTPSLLIALARTRLTPGSHTEAPKIRAREALNWLNTAHHQLPLSQPSHHATAPIAAFGDVSGDASGDVSDDASDDASEWTARNANTLSNNDEEYSEDFFDPLLDAAPLLDDHAHHTLSHASQSAPQSITPPIMLQNLGDSDAHAIYGHQQTHVHDFSATPGNIAWLSAQAHKTLGQWPLFQQQLLIALAYFHTQDPHMAAQKLSEVSESFQETSQRDHLIALLKKVTIYLPQITYAHQLRARIHSQAGEHPQAEEHLSKALLLDENNPYLHGQMALALYHQRKISHALKYQVVATQLNPSDSNYYNLACLNALLGHQDMALNYLERALELNPHLARQAAHDPDFKSLYDSPLFHGLLKGLLKKAPPLLSHKKTPPSYTE